ncbi:MAG: transposase [Myxococcota bacterium]
MAEDWALGELVAAKSTKGGIDVDWHDREARADVLDALARGVVGAVEDVRRHVMEVPRSKRKRLLKLCRHLLMVIDQNLESDEQGRLIVARKVAPGRLASLTDPEARHGRKSHGHASTRAPGQRAARRVRATPGGYGLRGAQLRHELAHVPGVHVLAPPPVGGHPKGRLAKQDFSIDFGEQRATCPQGVAATSRDMIRDAEHKRLAWRFHWSREDCDECPLRDLCLARGARRKRLKFHAYERELRRARDDWDDPEVRRAYKQRSQHERLINRLTRHGARKARSWGLSPANCQAHAIAMAGNLTLLARRLAEFDKPPALAHVA